MEDVPRIDAETAEEKQAVTEAVQSEAEVELAQSAKTGRLQHDPRVTKMAWIS